MQHCCTEEKHYYTEVKLMIRLDDERLKPSKTKYYVLAVVLLTGIIACLLMFFLYPRAFTITQEIDGRTHCGPKLYPYYLNINETGKYLLLSW